MTNHHINIIQDPKTPTIAELLERNVAYSQNHKPMPLIEEIVASGGGLPKTCIVTCVDPRVFPERLLGLEAGEALVFRTVAGHPHSIVEDIATVSIHGHDCVEDVAIIHHTDCGSRLFDVPRIRSVWVERDPSSKSRIEEMTFGAVQAQYGHKNQEDSLLDDVNWLKGQPLMRKGEKNINVKGYLYDITTGKLGQVV